MWLDNWNITIEGSTACRGVERVTGVFLVPPVLGFVILQVRLRSLGVDFGRNHSVEVLAYTFSPVLSACSCGSDVTKTVLGC